MNKWHGLISKKWLILILLFLTVPFFQNMSWVNIRDVAPLKPAGFNENPVSSYLPPDFHGKKLEDVGSGILTHNFDPWFQQFEVRYLRPATPYFGLSLLQKEDVVNGELASLASADQSSSDATGKWRMTIIRIGMTRPLSSHMGFSLFHQTGLRQSQLQMSYQF